MKIDIPQEVPRRHENGGAVSEHSATRKLPDNPILHRPRSLEEPGTDARRSRPRAKRPHDESASVLPHDRRRPAPSADPRRPARTGGNIVGLELRPEEKQLLREAGRFRVVRTLDLRETLYQRKARPLENDLKYLRDKGLIETRFVNLRRDGRRRTIERTEVVTLTKDGRRLLLKQGDLPKDQRVYAGLVKPREVEHDSQIYRAYRKESEKIEEKGGTNLRVKLDFEIKSQVQKAIYAERKADPKRDMAEIKEEVAQRLNLPFVDGKIQIPDARIEFDQPGGVDQDVDDRTRTGHEDIEVLTAAYHAGHLRAKAQAGFRNYASSSDLSTITSKIEDDHQMMRDILEL
jgi:hypothetical protein